MSAFTAVLDKKTDEIHQEKRRLFPIRFPLVFLQHLKAGLYMSLIALTSFVGFKIENAATLIKLKEINLSLAFVNMFFLIS